LNTFHEELGSRLETIRGRDLWRELRRVDSAQGPRIESCGRTLLNFSSNDYLGLANDSRLTQAAIRATEKYGAGSGASRLVCGSLAPHHELEERLALFKGAEAALSFSSGYATAVGTITALLGRDDVIIIDKRVHACVVDAARLSGARLRVFAHNDLNRLEAILKWARRLQARDRRGRILVVTESVFSMDGDRAPLGELVALKEKHGAWLMVDEAHATGLYGANRRGLAEDLGVEEQIEIQMGTLGKALGASGGYICGSKRLVDLLVNRARSFIFSTAPAPAAAGAAAAGVELVMSNEGERLRQKLWEQVAQLRGSLRHTVRFPTPPETGGKPPHSSPILPLIVGEEHRAVSLAAALYEHGILVPAIRYPTVARGAARLRLTVSATHTKTDIAELHAALAAIAQLHPDLCAPFSRNLAPTSP
jgi:8-amino-7-oxononanoate synthase